MPINELLKLYLGADEKGGYQPVGQAERLRQAFPIDYADKLRQIAPYLQADHAPDWTQHDLPAESRLFEAELRQKYPELDASVVRALANRWSYGRR